MPDLSDHYTQIAIQGPKGVNLLQKLTDADLSAVKNYWFTRGTVCGLKDILIARTGYTAEDGFEIYIPSDEATSATVWNEVIEAGKEFGSCPAAWARATPCAWKAACRSTATKFPTQSTSGKQDWTASARWKRPTSSGATRWSRQSRGLKRKLVGLEMIDRGIARDGYKVLDAAGNEIGYVTSGSSHLFLKKNIALAYVPPYVCSARIDPAVEIRGAGVKAQVVPRRSINVRRRLHRKIQLRQQLPDLGANSEHGLSRRFTNTPKSTNG